MLSSLEPAGPATSDADAWYEWVLRDRFGGDPACARALAPGRDAIRTTLLDAAGLAPHQTVADIGCGDGWVGLGALERQPSLEVTFVDRSPALVAHARAQAQARGVAAGCRFLVASASDLQALDDASVDVVLVRAVLAYLEDKVGALREFRRILRPGGRLSIVDPIVQDEAYFVAALAAMRRPDSDDTADRYVDLLHRWRSAQLPDSVAAIGRDPLTNYNERDLLRWCESAGFVNLHLRLHIDSVAAPPLSWAAFLAIVPRAGTASAGEILRTRFTPAERDEFERLFRSRVETGALIERNVNAYLCADAAPAP